MKFVGFILFSTLEYLTFVFFTLVLFRFNIREYVGKFLIFSIVLAFVSNTLQTESLQFVSPLIQAALMICFFAFFLRVHIFNAVIMVITGYVVNFLVSTIIMMVAYHFKRTDIVPYTDTAFIIQFASSFVMFSLGMVTRLQNGGFSFINQSGKFKKINFIFKENRPYIFFLALSIILIFAANLLFQISGNPPYLLISILLLLFLIGILYISTKREKQQSD